MSAFLDIARDPTFSNAKKAETTLFYACERADRLGDESPIWVAIAQGYATLAIADAIDAAGENGPGYTLSQAILAAGGMQP